MRRLTPPRTIAVLAIAGLLAACSATTTGGGGYSGYTRQQALDDILEAETRAASPDAAMSEARLDAEVEALYKLVPELKFPARFALARISRYGQLEKPADEEIASFDTVRQRLGDEFGEFVVLDPVMAELAAETVNATQRSARADLRRAAALIKADYALVYTSNADARSQGNALSVTDLTIIGAWIIPSRNVKAEAVAQASIVDIRTGIPLGSTSAEADKETLSRWSSEHSNIRNTREKAEAAAVDALTYEVEALARQLMVEAELQAKLSTAQDSKQIEQQHTAGENQ